MSYIPKMYKTAAIMVACVLFSVTAVFSGETIKWYNYEEGMALNKMENKKVYIDFYADWCGYCKLMDKNTFTDEKVIQFLNENFISIRVNAMKERKVAGAYGANQFPNHAFVDGNGQLIAKQPGYLSPSDFMKVISFIYEEKYKSSPK